MFKSLFFTLAFFSSSERELCSQFWHGIGQNVVLCGGVWCFLSDDTTVHL